LRQKYQLFPKPPNFHARWWLRSTVVPMVFYMSHFCRKFVDGMDINEKNLDDCLFSLMEMNLQKEIADTLVQISNLQFDPANAIT